MSAKRVSQVCHACHAWLSQPPTDRHDRLSQPPTDEVRACRKRQQIGANPQRKMPPCKPSKQDASLQI